MEPTIRPEVPADAAAIHAVNAAAFDTDAEARLVDALRDAGRLTLSLVAEERGAVVGHAAFSPVTLTRPDGGVLKGLGLAPMAVVPARQRAGVGSRLVAEGLRRLRCGGHPFCVVLGHPDYYVRFGFVPSARFGVRWEREVPEALFMIQELWPGGLEGQAGVVRYASEFDGL